MNRKMLQDLSTVRLAEARALLKAKFPDGAYYLGGYAVECALKARIAKRTQQHDFPDKKLVEKSYQHDLVTLLAAAGLDKDFKEATDLDLDLKEDWNEVKDWTEQRRYDLFYLPNEQDSVRRRACQSLARLFLDSVENSSGGVLPWIRRRW